MKVAIFGGTFNPIHYGHLLLAESAREQLALDRVVFIPANLPPHKRTAHVVSGEVRLELIRLAIRDQPAFVVSDIELQRPAVSYTLETIKILRRQLPEAKLYLLIGQDMLSVRWLGWDEIKRLATVVVAQRPGAKAPRREKGLKWMTMPQVEIASSEIRARLRAGRSIRYLVPPAVERYLRQHRVYER
jgi:nicotinate-nucleotide adenylyltransferase